MNAIGENNEYRTLKLRAEYLKGRCAEEIESYMALVTVGGDSIMTRYMLALGGLEHLAAELMVSALRWRRRFELRREAENRGECPDLVAIEEKVNAELAQYQAQLEEFREMEKELRRRQNAAVLSDEEVCELRHGYLSAAKKLHPDLVPNLPKAAMALWLKIQDAYREKEWSELKFLLGLVDGVLSGMCEMPPKPNGMDGVRAEVVRLEKKLADLVAKRQQLLREKPYCWAEMLEDEDEVSRRREALQLQIEEYKDAIADYEAMWNRKEAA